MRILWTRKRQEWWISRGNGCVAQCNINEKTTYSPVNKQCTHYSGGNGLESGNLELEPVIIVSLIRSVAGECNYDVTTTHD